MAHHNHTPATILAAPSRTFEAVAVHEGATRQERRHGVPSAMKVEDLALYLSTRNVPHVSGAARRGKKVRRNRAV